LCQIWYSCRRVTTGFRRILARVPVVAGASGLAIAATIGLRSPRADQLKFAPCGWRPLPWLLRRGAVKPSPGPTDLLLLSLWASAQCATPTRLHRAPPCLFFFSAGQVVLADPGYAIAKQPRGVAVATGGGLPVGINAPGPRPALAGRLSPARPGIGGGGAVHGPQRGL
jgi:hypothetical protein